MRLNIGCGSVVPEGWVHVDPVVYPEWGNRWVVATHSDANQAASPGGIYRGDPLDGLRWADSTAEGAVAHHVLQMVAWPDLVPWLVEVRRVLEPGAWLRVSVPDFPGAYAAALGGRLDWFPISNGIEPSIDGKLVTYLTQCGASRSLFTGPWLEDLMRRAGFGKVHTSRHGETAGPAWLTELDSREHESIYVEACA